MSNLFVLCVMDHNRVIIDSRVIKAGFDDPIALRQEYDRFELHTPVSLFKYYRSKLGDADKAIEATVSLFCHYDVLNEHYVRGDIQNLLFEEKMADLKANEFAPIFLAANLPKIVTIKLIRNATNCSLRQAMGAFNKAEAEQERIRKIRERNENLMRDGDLTCDASGADVTRGAAALILTSPGMAPALSATPTTSRRTEMKAFRITWEGSHVQEIIFGDTQDEALELNRYNHYSCSEMEKIEEVELEEGEKIYGCPRCGNYFIDANDFPCRCGCPYVYDVEDEHEKSCAYASTMAAMD